MSLLLLAYVSVFFQPYSCHALCFNLAYYHLILKAFFKHYQSCTNWTNIIKLMIISNINAPYSVLVDCSISEIFWLLCNQLFSLTLKWLLSKQNWFPPSPILSQLFPSSSAKYFYSSLRLMPLQTWTKNWLWKSWNSWEMASSSPRQATYRSFQGSPIIKCWSYHMSNYHSRSPSSCGLKK